MSRRSANIAMILLLIVSLGSIAFGDNQCERITVRLCQADSLIYNYTKFPNTFNHESQSEAGLEVQQFWPLVEINCSPSFREFLCSLYVPECRDGQVIPPDRWMCEQAREGCEPVMRQYGFEWPKRMNCTKFRYRNQLPETATKPLPMYSTCERIRVPLCKPTHTGYNNTRFPNFRNHTNQDDAGRAIHQWFPLVEVDCSPDLRTFICSLYVPKCVDGEKPSPPSRQLCLSSKAGCESLMNKFGFEWPSSMACDKFPNDQASTVGPTAVLSTETHSTCERITVPLCVDIGYNYTRFPNFLNHLRQDDAGMEVHQFAPLVKVNCSPYLRKFLCSLYVPKCIDGEAPLPPSQQLCLSAKAGCESLMKMFGFEWPSNLACDKFLNDQATTVGPTAALTETHSTCEKINVPLCVDIGYNYTRFPNFLNHLRQDDAGLEVHQFAPLVQVNCSPYLRKLLCSIYVPKCIDGEAPMPPSRQMCLSAKAGCENLMKKFGFQWPSSLTCEKFPDDQEVTATPAGAATCEQITFDTCNSLPYSYTGFPNVLNHLNQEDAKKAVINSFPRRLLRSCPALRAFVCSLYFPQCDGGVISGPPSRRFCRQAKRSCPALYSRYNGQTLSTMNCERYPIDTNGSGVTEARPSPSGACRKIRNRHCLGSLTHTHTTVEHNGRSFRARERKLRRFKSLIEANCAPEAAEFLCRLYFPNCHGDDTRRPIKSLCELTRAGCGPVFQQRGKNWPRQLNCDKM